MQTRELVSSVPTRMVLEQTKSAVASLPSTPGLAIVLFPDDPASAASISYARSIRKKAADVGIRVHLHELPRQISQGDLLGEIDALNRDASVDGILLMVPLPRHLNRDAATAAIRPEKDVNGFHPANLRAAPRNERRLLHPTHQSIEHLLVWANVVLTDLKIALVCSDSFGQPLAVMLREHGAYPHVTRPEDPDHADRLGQADSVVSLRGQPGSIRGASLKRGAVLIDAGMSDVGGTLRGDAHEDVKGTVVLVTPVTGGTGPLTTAYLLRNVGLAYKLVRSA